MSEPSQNFSHQANIFDPGNAKPVTVIGAGSVGSKLVLELASIGCTEITVWDGDDVASHNVPMSAYRHTDLGRFKTIALQELVRDKSGVNIKVVQRMYNGEPLQGTVVSCVDWMDERKKIWEQVRHNPLVDLFVDTRTAIQLLEVYAVQPCNNEDVAFYETRLYPSSDAIRPTCGTHGISPVTSITAGVAAAALTRFWKKGTNSRVFSLYVGSLTPV